MIEATGVSLKNRLDDISLRVETGKITALLGLDGAGKTSLLDALAGVAELDAGSLNAPVSAYMTQKSPLFEEMTVRANLKFTCDLEGLGHARSDERIRAIASQTGLDEYLDKPASALSLPLRRRAALALALIPEGENRLLDEPTRDLDSGDALRLRKTIRELRAGRAIVLATRSVTEAERLADEILVMRQGRVIARCQPGRLDEMARDEHVYSARLADDPEKVRAAGAGKVESQNGYVEARFPCEDPAGLLAGLVEKGLHVLEFGPAKLDLEDMICALDADAYAGEADEA